ncbi:MAG TPA: hypothetical protein VGF55_22555 [Gemmataceae bacterium]|jgi:hypothetical protein
MSAVVPVMPTGRQRKVGRLITILSVPVVALGTVAYTNAPAANAGAVHLTPAEGLGIGLIACGVTCLLAGLAVWVHAAATEAKAADDGVHSRVNHWRGPAVPVRRR